MDEKPEAVDEEWSTTIYDVGECILASPIVVSESIDHRHDRLEDLVERRDKAVRESDYETAMNVRKRIDKIKQSYALKKPKKEESKVETKVHCDVCNVYTAQLMKDAQGTSYCRRCLAYRTSFNRS